MSTPNDNQESTNHIGLILAVIAGLLALGMTFVFLKKMQSNVQSPSQSAATYTDYATKEILVAVRDLPPNHVIHANNDLKIVKVPKNQNFQAFYRNCVSAEYAQEMEGRRISHAIPANYPLLYSNLANISRLDDVFTEGFLKTITVDRVNFFSSHLVPGDRVDILVSSPRPEPADMKTAAPVGSGNDQTAAIVAAAMRPLMEINKNTNERPMETKVILENAEVFMVGSHITAHREVIGDATPENINSSSEITFRLSRDDAIMLTNYVNSGNCKISLLLRPRSNNRGNGNAPESIMDKLDNEQSGKTPAPTTPDNKKK